MTGQEHYLEAERLITLAREGRNALYGAWPGTQAAIILADAQVHATLALAAATGVHDAGVVPSGMPRPRRQAFWHLAAA
jgi:hypothetical protein